MAVASAIAAVEGGGRSGIGRRCGGRERCVEEGRDSDLIFDFNLVVRKTSYGGALG